MLDDLLHDPDALVDVLLAWLVNHSLHLAVAVPAATIVLELTGTLLWQLRHHRWKAGARCLEILAPPAADLPGAIALWGNLIGLLSPAPAFRVIRGS